jgi:hypothetical protein
MTAIQFNLPDKLAADARAAGLLSDEKLEALIVEQLRRQALNAIAETHAKIAEAGIPKMSPDEVNVEIKAARAERRAVLAR